MEGRTGWQDYPCISLSACIYQEEPGRENRENEESKATIFRGWLGYHAVLLHRWSGTSKRYTMDDVAPQNKVFPYLLLDTVAPQNKVSEIIFMKEYRSPRLTVNTKILVAEVFKVVYLAWNGWNAVVLVHNWFATGGLRYMSTGVNFWSEGIKIINAGRHYQPQPEHNHHHAMVGWTPMAPCDFRVCMTGLSVGSPSKNTIFHFEFWQHPILIHEILPCTIPKRNHHQLLQSFSARTPIDSANLCPSNIKKGMFSSPGLVWRETVDQGIPETKGGTG